MSSKNGFQKFFLVIILPSVLAIVLFIVSIYMVIIPQFEKNSMERKKEMIRELTQTAWSLINEYDQEVKKGEISMAEARVLASAKIEQMRYGNEGKDYFWITDFRPVMIMHPYRQELNDTDLNNYKDPQGKKLFVEAVDIVTKSGEGFIDYFWQWKDEQNRIVPKLSYVKAYPEWGWILGTGIYLEDVKAEISKLKGHLLRISLLITLVIVLTLLFVIRQSLNIENRRKSAEEKLKLSREKYKALVQASTEGTLMIINDKIVFSNLRFSKMAGYGESEIYSKRFDELFETKLKQLSAGFDNPQKSLNIETRLICNGQTRREVVVTASKINFAGENGIIVVIKDPNKLEKIEKQTEQLNYELQTSLLLMNQPVKHFVSNFISCGIDSTIKGAAELMNRKNKKVIFVKQNDRIIGVIDDKDFRSRVFAQGLNEHELVTEIMSSPVASIHDDALLYEALHKFSQQKVSHLAVKNRSGEIIGAIGNKEVLEIQQNSLSHLINEIGLAEDILQLKQIYLRVPVLVNALIESGDKAQNITRLNTSVSDAITQRVISLAIETTGNAPCKFAFMALGSEGRMEQTLLTDQDNAIIFENVKAEKIQEVQNYFQKLAKSINKSLDFIGYNYCKGEVMAQNPKWTQPFVVWEKYFSSWIDNSDPQSILDSSIFFDFRCVYGDEELTDKLRDFVINYSENKAVFFYHLAQSIIKIKLPVSLFGNIKSEQETDGDQLVDLKKTLMPISGFVRIYAIRNKLKETNTPANINALFENKVISKTQFDKLIISYNYLMMLRFSIQTNQLLSNNVPDNRLDISKLTDIEIATLKKIFSEIGQLQTQLGFDFKGGTL